MTKVFTVLCVLILIATFGFLAKGTIGIDSAQKVQPEIQKPEKSYVVNGSFTKSVES
jgi:hypothetical protein